MEAENVEIIELELKYCERCGGLWLRVRGKDDVYCTSCTLQVSTSSNAKPRHAVKKPMRRRGNLAKPLQLTPRQGGKA